MRTDDRKRAEGDDRAAIELGRGQVDHRPGLAGLVGQQTPDDLLPGALRPAGQRRVKVQHGEAGAQVGTGDQHVAGQHEQLDVVGAQQAGDVVVEGEAPGLAHGGLVGKPAAVEDVRPGLPGAPARGARQGGGGQAEVAGEVEKGVAFGLLAALPVAEHDGDVEVDGRHAGRGARPLRAACERPRRGRWTASRPSPRPALRARRRHAARPRVRARPPRRGRCCARARRCRARPPRPRGGRPPRGRDPRAARR